MKVKRKLQVSNGHYLMFDQLARLVHAMNSSAEKIKITMSYLEEETGLPFRQVRNRISIGRAMGIFENRMLKLTPFGRLVSIHDTFFEASGTLEFVHYLAASNFNNLIWYDVFNNLLPKEPPLDYQGWLNYFRTKFADEYSEYSLKEHVRKEVSFIIDAYLRKNFDKLNLLHQTSDGKLFFRRHSNMNPLVLSAVLYHHARNMETKLLQIKEIAEGPGTPGIVFAMDEPTVRQAAETLHERGWVRYEATHNLNQVRLKEGFIALDFLTAYYNDETPQPSG